MMAGRRITPVLMMPAGASPGARAAFSEIEGVEVLELPVTLGGRWRTRLLAILVGRDNRLERWLLSHHIDLVFEATDFIGWRNRIPALAWIPDLQHKHLPNMFEPSRLWGRELLYQLQTRSGRIIMLSSDVVRRECEKFYPASRGRTTVVRFCVPPSAASVDSGLAQRYQLPEEYLYLPNQFWKHKNHDVIIEALSLLRRDGRSVTVVASGNPSDVRDAEYFPGLLRRIESLDLGDSWRFLGLIPYKDVHALMRSSVAVINPSLAEGWSTTVEEAKSLRVPLVLSDIPVHREQAIRDAVFFDPRSPAMAAAAMLEALMRFAPMPRGAERPVDPDWQERLRMFGSEFTLAVEVAIDGRAAFRLHREDSEVRNDHS
jgi:glycosyltransferase involved in cell wall biosynthesis